jgi:hypothetical protein
VHGQKLLKWNVNLFLFVEPDMLAHIFSERKKLGLLHKTMICPTTVEHSRYFPLLGQIQTMFAEGKISAGSNPTKDTALYVWCTMAKADALRQAMDMNVFQSQKFFWIDFGLSHVAKDPQPSLDYLLGQLANSHHHRVRVHNLRRFTPEETQDSARFYSRLDQCVAGGFFGGSLNAMRWFVDVWEAEMHESLKSFPTLEQGLFARIWTRHPFRFQTVEAYVDGHGLLLQPRSNELLFRMLKEATESRDWRSVDALATEFVPHPFAGEWKDRELQTKVCDVLVAAKRGTLAATPKVVTDATAKVAVVAPAPERGAPVTPIPVYCLSKAGSERRRKMEKRFQLTGVSCRFVDPDEISDVQARVDQIFTKLDQKAPPTFDYRMTAIMNNHLKMVKTFLNESKSAAYGVFCEDDIHLSLSLRHELRHLCSIQQAQNAAVLLVRSEEHTTELQSLS